MTYSSSRAPLLLLEDSGSKRRKEFDSLDGGACHPDKSVVKSTDKPRANCVNNRYHSTFSNETETDSAKLNDKPFKCDALFMFILFSFSMGAFIIVFTFLIYFEMFDLLFISISYLLLSVSLGVALLSSSIWRILQYCPLNCCLECIKETHAFNIFCIVLGLCLMALAVIGLLDEFSDSYEEHDHIRYPLWLDLSLFVVSVACFMFVSWVNTQYARMQKEKSIFLQNYYYNKMIADEGAANDYKQNEDKIPTYIQKNGPLHPYDRSIFSFIFHTFTHFHLFDVIRLGSKKTLQTFDCYFPPKPDDIEYNFDKWRKLHRKQQKERGKGKIGTFSLLWAIESKSFLLLCVISLVSTLPGLVVPTIIGKLANFYEDLSVDLYVGITLTVGLLVIGVIRIFFGAMLMTFASCVAGRVNGLLSYVIYHKAINMSISNESTAELCTGQNKVALLAADTRMIAYALAYQPIFVAQYIMMAAVIILLHVELGLSALAGWLFVIVISFPVQSVLGGRVMAAWKGYMTQSGKRVSFIDELIKGIKVTKLYSWERALMNEVLNYRRQEMERLFKRIKFNSILAVMNGATPPVMLLIMIGTYVSLGNTLSVQTVFAVITLVQMLGFAIRILPVAMMIGVGGIVAITRLNKFYNAPDQIDMILAAPKQDDVVTHVMDDSDYNEKYVVYMKNASFKWPKITKDGKKDSLRRGSLLSAVSVNYNDEKEEHSGFLLEQITIKLERGKLYALVGAKESGKSSLIQAILREMEQINGVLKVNGCTGNSSESIGYVSQTPFCTNDTVRANVLWGLPYNEKYYTQCLKASSLGHDLKILANGDLTEIGEKGINLSAGQKQRISFCRALYRANITNLFLFDAPLSAVDSPFGSNMFTYGITELLADKTILLVLDSHLHLLQYMDEIIILDKGKLVVQTTYDEVIQNESYLYLLPEDTREKTEEEQKYDEKEQKYDEKKKETDTDEEKTYTPQAVGYGTIEPAVRGKKGEGKTGVAWKTYFQYFSNAVNPFNHNGVVNDYVPRKRHIVGVLWLLFDICLLMLSQVLLTGADIWLAFWAEEGVVQRYPGLGDDWWLIIWSVIIGLLILITFVSTYLFGWLGNKAAQSLHMKTLYCVLRAPMSYFDKTPRDSILNRFSKDTNEMDIELPSNFVGLALQALLVVGYLVVISWSMPYAMLMLVVLLPTLYTLQRYFRMSSSDFKRLTQVTMTPILSQFSETLKGLDTIRAYKCTESLFLKSIRQKIRVNHKIILSEQLGTRWFANYMDLLLVMFLLGLTLLCAFLRDTFEAGLLSLGVVYANSLMGMLQWAIRSSVDVEKNFVTIERFLYYEDALKRNAKRNKLNTDEVDTENDLITSEAKEINFAYRPPNASWPHRGKIVIKNLKMRYRPDLDLVLKGLSMEINAGEKVGICGKSGAGKSSLLLALFRLIEPTKDSLIEIDDVNCLKLGLKDLRQSLRIIPQEPVLFTGSLRFNLDPFQKRRDGEIWDVLKKCELFDFVQSKEDGLDFIVRGGGSKLTVGQKQLICVGRALLSKSKVLALDELNTFDPHTESVIQTLIRKEFANATVLCIAHKLDIIMDYDKIIVLAKGKIIECDTPYNLLNDLNGEFYKMVHSARTAHKQQ